MYTHESLALVTRKDMMNITTPHRIPQPSMDAREQPKYICCYGSMVTDDALPVTQVSFHHANRCISM
jgi:hypothetical protein